MDNSKKQNAKFLGNVISDVVPIDLPPTTITLLNAVAKCGESLDINEAIIEARYKRFRQVGQITHFISNATPKQSFFIGTENGIEDIEETTDQFRARRMSEEGITEQDIFDTMPDNPFQ